MSLIRSVTHIQDRNKLLRDLELFKLSMDRKITTYESLHHLKGNKDLTAWLKGEDIHFNQNAVMEIETITPHEQIKIFKFILSKRKDSVNTFIWKDNDSLHSAVTKLPAADLKSLLSTVMASSCRGGSPLIKSFLSKVNDVQIIKDVIWDISNAPKRGDTNYKYRQLSELNSRLNAIQAQAYVPDPVISFNYDNYDYSIRTADTHYNSIMNIIPSINADITMPNNPESGSNATVEKRKRIDQESTNHKSHPPKKCKMNMILPEVHSKEPEIIPYAENSDLSESIRMENHPVPEMILQPYPLISEGNSMSVETVVEKIFHVTAIWNCL